MEIRLRFEMKIVIAPDSFKESLTAIEAASAIEQGFRLIFPDADYVKVPLADGGEGTVQTLVDATRGNLTPMTVTGPLGLPVMAHYGFLGQGFHQGDDYRLTAVIEMASASGLQHAPHSQRNPLQTTSYGTGELIKDALDKGAGHIILGLGGSATNDGGAGMLQALGFKLLDKQGRPLARGGASLTALARIEVHSAHPRLQDCRFTLACDVTNTLCGNRGASRVFAPQKGATADMVALLEQALEHFASTIVREGLEDRRDAPGAGAAGGMGLAAMVFLGAEYQSGIALVMNILGMAETLQDARLVITGEGCIDGQSVNGKSTMGILALAKAQEIPVIGIGGCLGEGAALMLDEGMSAIFPSVQAPMFHEQVLKQAKTNLTNTARNIAATLRLAGFGN
jgi:glycerate 2-kinase